MAPPEVSDPTSSSLIGRVKRRDADAWEQMTRLFGPLVYRWARQCGLQDHDAADVTQEVFSSVARAIDGFQHGLPGNSFRGWLWTITRNSVRQQMRRQQRHPAAVGGTDAHERLQQVPDLVDSDEEPAGFDARAALARRALELIEPEFEPHTWQAFVRLTLHMHSAGEVADDLGIAPGAVRQAKYRVLCRVRELLDGA